MKKTNPTTLRKVLKYIGKYKLLLPVTLLFAAITVALTLYVPILIGDAIDLIVGKDNVDFKKIGEILTLAAILIVITALLQWLMSTINNRITYHVAADVRRDAFNKIEKLPLSTLDTKSHGDILSRTVNDTEQFAEGLLLGFTQLFTGVLTIIGTLGLLIWLRWQIALVVFVLTPLSLFIARFIAKRTFNLFREQAKAKGAQTALIDEMITNQKLVKAFHYEDTAKEKFEKVNDDLGRASLRAIFYSSITNPATRFIYATVYAAVALVGALTVIDTMNSAAPFTVGMLSCILIRISQHT